MDEDTHEGGSQQAQTERLTKESIGEGEPGASEYVTDEDAVDQAESGRERL